MTNRVIKNIDNNSKHLKRVEAVRRMKIRLGIILSGVLIGIILMVTILATRDNRETNGTDHTTSEAESSYSAGYSPTHSLGEDTTSLGMGPFLNEIQIVEEERWKLLLVNWENPIPEDFQVTLENVEGEFLLDIRIIQPFQDMLYSMRTQGLSPVLVFAYRSNEHQATLFENNVARYMSYGLSLEEATQEARRLVAAPGTSEHETGLAVDILSVDYQHLPHDFGQSPEGIWLANYSADFGFILRYPRDTEHITGIIYEPWHFRYVGIEIARYITYHNITLEEFLIRHD
jgi:LAS superfamily LD-carboxypeptidase LdcB